MKQDEAGMHKNNGRPEVAPQEGLLAAAAAVSYLKYPALSSLIYGTCQLPSPFRLLLLPHAARLLQDTETTQDNVKLATPLT